MIVKFLVDSDNYLHQEEDPRYRGAAIPSRAFRYLQNMTDSNEPPANPNGKYIKKNYYCSTLLFSENSQKLLN